MSEESKAEWQNSKQIIDGILGKCVRIWLNFDKADADQASKQERALQIRLGLQLASRYLRVLRMDDDVKQAAQNALLIEESQMKIKQLERQLQTGDKDAPESKETS